MPGDDHSAEMLTAEKLANPLLEKLNRMAMRHAGIRFLVVFPKSEGWGQVSPGGDHFANDFCRLIQSSREGAEHCRMCHILMAIASAADGSKIQRCHAGASALVNSVAKEHGGSLAVLSSCIFVAENADAAWEAARRRGEKLGLDPQRLQDAYRKLPALSGEQMELATAILDVAGEALREIKERLAVEAALERARQFHSAERDVEVAVERELRQALSTLRIGKSPRAGVRAESSSSLIDIVSELVEHKPNMPYSVSAIAAASRMTPNHFSYLFHRHRKQCFSEFLTDQRLELAKSLLKDLTLSVSEVALKAGFHDAGYFARRFKQKARLSPREWRSRLTRPKPRARSA
jgi:AraC-like DNA-binding protein/ligand-binding sensor protein